MRNRFVLVGALLMCSYVTGCYSDLREGLVGKTVDLLEQTTGKVKSVRERIEDAMKNADKEGGLKLTEAGLAATELKNRGLELQQTSLGIRGQKEQVKEEERARYIENYKDRIQRGLLNLEEETLVLNKRLGELEKLPGLSKDDKAAVEQLVAKIKDAQSEFDKLARQQ